MFNFFKKMNPFAPKWYSEEIESEEFSSAQLILMGPTEQRRFLFTKNFMIERVMSSDEIPPKFREEFVETSQCLLKIDHPGILKLADFKNESDVLYRIWERRDVYPACLGSVEDHKSIVNFLEGLQLLNSVGFSYGDFASDCYSMDDRGPFVMRLPYTLSGSYAKPREKDLVFRSPHTLYYVNPNVGTTGEQVWLFYTGCILCTMLKQGFPFNGVPMLLAREGKLVKKLPMAIEGKVGEVLGRFLAINSEEPYSDIEEGFDALKKALLTTSEICYRSDVLNTWKHLDNSVLIPDECKHLPVEFSANFSEN